MVEAQNKIKQRLKEFKVLEGDSFSVLFDRQTYNIKIISKEPAAKLSSLIEAVDQIPDQDMIWQEIEDILNYFTDVDVSIPQTIQGIEESKKNESSAEAKSLREELPPQKYLNKLAINVSNACNLRCAYCYANQGVYGNPNEFLMSVADVELAVRRFAEKFDYIEHIQFMGGEPSLNPKALAKTVEIFREMTDKGAFKAMPTFGMVSNGVSFTKEFWQVIKEHNMSITFSLDGPKEVHDAQRIDTGGKGSFDRVVANIHQLKEEGLNYDFEATYSRAHLNYGMTLSGLCQWFYETFNLRVLHAPIMFAGSGDAQAMALTSEEQIQALCDVTQWGLGNLLKDQYLMHGFTNRLLENFLNKHRAGRICPAGSGVLTVTAKGDVCPCWMFADEEPFYMGNINKDDFLSVRAAAVLQTMDQYDLLTDPNCQACWIQPLCFGCKGNDWLSTKAINVHPACDSMRKMTEVFLSTFSNVLFEFAKRKQLINKKK
jgi:uncharacterized protein